MYISKRKAAKPQQVRRHLVRLSKAQRRNPNRPRVESFSWRRSEAFRIIHERVRYLVVKALAAGEAA